MMRLKAKKTQCQKKDNLKNAITYLCRRRNTPHKIKVPVTSIHPMITKLQQVP